MTSAFQRSIRYLSVRGPRRAPVRTVASLAIGGVLAASLGVSPARAGERELHAPYLRFDAENPATLHVTDDGHRGALIRIQLVDREGRLASYGDHPVTISRAVPPGESIRIDLAAFWSDAHEGSLTLSASRPVRARVDLAAGGYPLVPRRSGKILIPLGETPPASASLALVACGEAPVDAALVRRRAGDVADTAKLRLPAGASRLVPLDGLRAGDVLELETASAVALILVSGRDAGALRESGSN